ncbi:hypothetical protein OG948_01800 [Embleya sp. NBC_00888]|uniref:hypothetical protein n=1 Tax=Embleya sp. NBC_00888 TaxID=2975960 RepID=UPI003864EB93|nr:hypothetical protein OG948_01800 [Embleya sp. NBC_00888]
MSLAEPGVPVSEYRALHGPCRSDVVETGPGVRDRVAPIAVAGDRHIEDTDRRTADAGEHIENRDDVEPGDGDRDNTAVEERFLVRSMTDRDPTLLRDRSAE